MAPGMEDEPRYGRRADDAPPAADAPQGAGYAPGEAASPGTPWPQYGRVDAGATPGYGTYAGASTPTNEAPGYGAPAQGAPSYGAPAPGPYPSDPAAYGAPDPRHAGYGNPNIGYPQPPLPGRGGAIALLVIGAVVAIFIAPIALFLGVAQGMNLGALMNSMDYVSSGQTVSVDDSGSYLVATQSVDVYSCALEGAGGTHTMETFGTGAFFSSGLEPGDYVLTCEGEGTFELLGASGLSPDAVTNAGLSGLAWGSIVGILGLVLAIWGIVRLVRVNKKRREIMRTAYRTPW